MPLPNFPYTAVDRNVLIRGQKQLVNDLLTGTDSRLMLWHKGELVMRKDKSLYFFYAEVESKRELLSEMLYLGKNRQHHYFTCNVDHWDSWFDEYLLVNLRSASKSTFDHHLALLFYAQGLLNWHRNHAFCSSCGGTMSISQAGHARTCNDSNCGKTHYPKIDPAVIFSIVNDQAEEPRILLGRQPHWDANRYSVIAGFVEPGESLEDAVRREAYEETGLMIRQIDYAASQPWPFPDSLMMGFECQTDQTKITLHDRELEAAGWYSAGDLERKIKRGEIKMPFPMSISWHLIDRWFDLQKGYSMSIIKKG